MSYTKKLSLLSMMIAFAILLSFFERMIPFTIGIPGVKLGLANTVSLLAILLIGYKEAFIILLIRVTLVSLLFGGFSAAMYSYTGGILSVLGMCLVYHLFKDKVSCIGLSVLGAVLHNIGQITMAVIIVNNVRLYSYLTILLLASIITGCLTGTVSNGLVYYLKKNKMVSRYITNIK